MDISFFFDICSDDDGDTFVWSKIVEIVLSGNDGGGIGGGVCEIYFDDVLFFEFVGSLKLFDRTSVIVLLIWNLVVVSETFPIYSKIIQYLRMSFRLF